MRRFAAALLLVGLGCGGATKPAPRPAAAAPAGPAAAPPTGPVCGLYAIMRIAPAEPPYSGAFEAIEQAAYARGALGETASNAEDHPTAASHYLACGEQYGRVPEGDVHEAHARTNAATCFENAMYSYANAAMFVAVGRGRLEAAAAANPRVKPLIDAVLAKSPPDCVVTSPAGRR